MLGPMFGPISVDQSLLRHDWNGSYKETHASTRFIVRT